MENHKNYYFNLFKIYLNGAIKYNRDIKNFKEEYSNELRYHNSLHESYLNELHRRKSFYIGNINNLIMEYDLIFNKNLSLDFIDFIKGKYKR